MMSNDPITDVIKMEGGFVNLPEDKGGPTNLGITQKSLSEYLGRPASVEDVRRLSEATAREIYERKYYSGPRIDLLPEPPRNLVFDMSVNHGPKRAIKILQKALNQVYHQHLSIDGVLGPTTRGVLTEALATLGAAAVQNEIVNVRIAYYDYIVRKDPSQKKFYRGWVRRAKSFLI